MFLYSLLFSVRFTYCLSLYTSVIEHFDSYGEFAYCVNEDQRSYQRYALEHPHKVSVDEHSEMFLCLHGRQWQVDIEVLRSPPSTEFSSNNTALVPVFHEESSQDIKYRPLVLHFNSVDGKTMMITLLDALQKYSENG